ncbi:MAG: hypothetical protein ACKVS6_12525 [Planctomycetota bacterium]
MLPPPAKLTFAPFTIVAALAGNLFAFQDSGALPPVGFERDADLARKLAGMGHKKHADWLIDKLRKTPNITEAQRAELSFVEATNLVSLFENERDYDKARGTYDQAIAAIDGYLKIAKPGPSTVVANYLKGDLDRRLGERITDQIRREPSAEKKGVLLADGEKAFQRAIAYFAARREEIHNKLVADGADPSQDRDYLAALYAVPNTYLSYAMMYPKEDAKQQSLLTSAESQFEKFIMDCPEGSIAYFEAAVKWGNARRELGNTDAVDCYQQALELMYWRDEDNEKHVVEPGDLKQEEKALIIEAVTEASRLWNLQKSYSEITDAYADVRKAIPKFDEEFAKGFELIFEAARAYDALGKIDDAKREARRIVTKAPPDLFVYNEARELLARHGESAEVMGEVTLSQAVGMIESFMKKDMYPEAVRAYYTTRDRYRGTPAEAKFLPEMMWRGGISYHRGGRALEAYLLLLELGEKFPQFAESPKALSGAVDNACRVWIATKAPWGEDLAQRALDKLQQDHPDNPITAETYALFLQAQQLVGGKSPIELAKLGEEQLKPLSKTELKYGRIVFDTGLKYYRAGNSALGDAKKKLEVEQARVGADRCFDLYLEWVAAQTTLDQSEVLKNQDRQATSYLNKAQMWLWEPGSDINKVLENVQKLEDFAGKVAAARAKLFDAELVKLRALSKQGKFDQAATIADGMFSKDAANPRTASAQKRIAESAWESIKTEKDVKKREALIDQALKFYRHWIKSGEKQQNALDSVNYYEVGQKFFQLALLKNGMEPKTYPASFYLLDLAKFPYQDPLREGEKLFESAVKADTGTRSDFSAPVARYIRGQILGILQNWKALVAEYEEIVKSEELIDTKEDALVAVKGRRNYRSEQIVNDLAWAHAKLAAAGDKEAGKRAQELASKAIRFTDPGSKKPTFDYWFAKYINVFATIKNGERVRAQEALKEYRRLDREFDNNEFGFKAKFEALEAEVGKN